MVSMRSSRVMQLSKAYVRRSQPVEKRTSECEAIRRILQSLMLCKAVLGVDI
jgi:hypothetical protein